MSSVGEFIYVHTAAKNKNGNGNGAKLVAEAIEAAEEAGLRYITDEQPGYTRKASGDDFEYFDIEGKPIGDEPRLLRLKRLAIPPAWTDVWICPAANCHIQATGRDARRRKQYIYHEGWREVRDENKYARLAEFGAALPKIRKRVAADIALRDLSRNKVLATVVQLLERTFIRIGNEEYARQNKSFGLTTMKDRHVKVKGAQLRFHFRGKSGKMHEVDLTDRRLAKIVSRLQDLPGQDLFQYLDDACERRSVTSQDVNDYLREISGSDFTAKDFRTWAGTVLAAMALQRVGKAESKKQAKANVTAAIKAVSQMLGNTPAICRKCYVHPRVLENYLAGSAISGVKDADLGASELAVLKFLKRQ